MHKQGFTDIIFKWIFGLIAGALIIIFFVHFATQHITISEALNTREQAAYLDDQLEAFGIAESSSKTINLQRTFTLATSCDGFGFGDAQKKTNKVIFAPQILEGTTLNAWTESWDYPYKITNLYYLSNKNGRVLLVYDDNSAAFVRDLKIPSIFNVQKIDVRDFHIEAVKRESSTLQHLNLAFFTHVSNPQQFVSSFSFPVDVVEIEPATQKITYYNSGTTSFYPSVEFVYGAIIGPENYACLLDKALKRKEYVTQVYEHKAELLRLKTHDETCNSALTETSKTLNTFKTLQDQGQLEAYKNDLEEQNKHLEKNDCTPLY